MWHRFQAWYHRLWTDRPIEAGTKLHTYQIEKILGLGSYGIAYLVRHLQTDELFVAKQVKPSLYHSPKGLEMQEYEKMVLQALSHPQIPRFLEQFQWKKNAFLVMEFIQGQTLEEMLFDWKERFQEVDALQLMREVALVVSYVHEQGIIHRDVRIPNVILRDGKPCLIDFGLARFIGDRPTYSSLPFDQYPEEKQLKRAVSPQSDLYALGHFLLFLLYSTYSPTGAAERSWEEELTLHDRTRDLIRRLLSMKTPYQSVRELLGELETHPFLQK